MRYLKKGTFKYRISVGAPVYMAAVIEYLAGNVPSPALPSCSSHSFQALHLQDTVDGKRPAYLQVVAGKRGNEAASLDHHPKCA